MKRKGRLRIGESWAMSPSFTSKSKGGDCLSPSFWWKGPKKAPKEQHVPRGWRGILEWGGDKLERSKSKNLCLASKVVERENPSILPPTVGIKNAWALLWTKYGPGGDRLKLLYTLFKTAWTHSGIPVVCSKWTVEKPGTEAEQQQCSSIESYTWNTTAYHELLGWLLWHFHCY